MAYEGWIEFDGVELVNVARTLLVARKIGVNTVRVKSAKAEWLRLALAEDGGAPVDPTVDVDLTQSPWYDARYPASAEFAGVVPLSFAGLGDSTLTSTPREFIGDAAAAGPSRNGSLPIVANVALIASTERGAEYGKRWMDRVLRGAGRGCSGSVLTYFRYPEDGAPKAHMREVKTTRGSSITRRKASACAVTWTATFTWTAHDPYEYGPLTARVASLGGSAVAPAGEPPLAASGTLTAAQTACPQYDYSPIYDPLYPALVPSPTAPTFYPDGWAITEGRGFRRYWARVDPLEPSTLLSVPVITLTTTTDARMVRVSVWPSDSDPDDQCDPLFSAVVTYLPANQQFVIDGEQKTAYIWDGASPAVRRSDSLVYGPEAEPVQWTAFTDHDNLLVTLDVFATSGGNYEGGGNVRAALALVSKSD